MPFMRLKCDANFHAYHILYKKYRLTPKFVRILKVKLYFLLDLFCDVFFLQHFRDFNLFRLLD